LISSCWRRRSTVLGATEPTRGLVRNEMACESAMVSVRWTIVTKVRVEMRVSGREDWCLVLCMCAEFTESPGDVKT